MGRMNPLRLPSLRHLRYFVALADSLSFRAAAQACFVSQSTLSEGIKELESTLAVTLVERDTRSVRLTQAGSEISVRARRLLGDASDLMDAAGAMREPLSSTLRLGVIPTIAPYLFPRVLPPLRERHPRLKLILREDLSARLLERLHGGDLDTVLMALPYETGDLHVRELFRDEFWLVSPADEPLVKRRSVDISRIDPNDVILLEDGHCLREHAIAACSVTRKGAVAASAIQATSLPTLLQMVESGLGMTLLPELALKGGALNGTSLVARPFSNQVPARMVALAWRQNASRTVEFEMLADLIVRHAWPARRGIPGGRRVRTPA